MNSKSFSIMKEPTIWHACIASFPASRMDLIHYVHGSKLTSERQVWQLWRRLLLVVRQTLNPKFTLTLCLRSMANTSNLSTLHSVVSLSLYELWTMLAKSLSTAIRYASPAQLDLPNFWPNI